MNRLLCNIQHYQQVSRGVEIVNLIISNLCHLLHELLLSYRIFHPEEPVQSVLAVTGFGNISLWPIKRPRSYSSRILLSPLASDAENYSSYAPSCLFKNWNVVLSRAMALLTFSEVLLISRRILCRKCGLMAYYRSLMDTEKSRRKIRREQRHRRISVSMQPKHHCTYDLRPANVSAWTPVRRVVFLLQKALESSAK